MDLPLVAPGWRRPIWYEPRVKPYVVPTRTLQLYREQLPMKHHFSIEVALV